MWKTLSKTAWPDTGNYHRVRKGTVWYIALFENDFMLLPGSSLRTRSRLDFDINEWEYFTKKIEDLSPLPAAEYTWAV